MSRGRKPNQIIKNDLESIFLNSVGNYVQLINTLLSKEIEPEPLSNYIRIAGGYAFKSSNYSIKGIPVIRISDFNNERIILDNVKYYQEDEALKKYELHQGDIVIALTGGTIAKLGIVQEGIGKLYLNQRVGKFEILNPEIFENEYIYWIARSVQSIIKNLAWGAAIPNVSPKQIEKLEFPIPEKKVQKGIINFLNDLKNNKIKSDVVYFNSEIEKQIVLMHQNQVDGTNLSIALTHQLSLVKKLRQSFLQEAMQGKLIDNGELKIENEETGTELLAKIKAEKKRLIKEKKIKQQKTLPPIAKEEIPFDIPKNWVWCRLGEISEIGTGATPLTSNNEYYYKGKIPWITSSATNNLFVKEPELFITEKALKETNCKIYPTGTLIVAMYGQGKTRGQITELMFDATTNQACAAITLYLKDFFLRKFIKQFFQKIYLEIRELAQGGAQPNLNMGKIKNTIVPLPPLSEQKSIVTKLDELMAYCDSLEESIKNSQTQNEMLLQQVLREALEPTNEAGKPKEKEVVV